MLREQYETARLILRLSDPALAAPVADYCWRNRGFLRETEPDREESYYTEEGQRIRLLESRARENAGLEARFWIAKKEEPERVIGMAALNNIVMGAFCSCFLAYQMDQGELRRGYAAEAVKRLTEIAFQDVGLHRIEANILPRNTPSLELSKKLGFQCEGTSPRYLLINGVWEDHVHMVLLNDAWEAL